MGYLSIKNKQADILLKIKEEKSLNRRLLSEKSGYSIGFVNKTVNDFLNMGITDENGNICSNAKKMIKESSPENAIILAAGPGMRMVPINTLIPKSFLEVKEEKLIERTIRQLHSKNITDITVVVGFMKEKFEYLIDEYDVKLVVNKDYGIKNNLYSLNLVKDKISNTYILPCDLWFENNPFSEFELYSWYMVSDAVDAESNVRVNRKNELKIVSGTEEGNRMVGLCYLKESDSKRLVKNLELLTSEKGNDGLFWEEALFDDNMMFVSGRTVNDASCIEINTYEQLRDFDSGSNNLDSKAIKVILETLKCENRDIVNIELLKKGMTNRSFCFEVKKDKYIMRIPGEGTEKLIDRKKEYENYRAIKGCGLCDEPVYINPDNGYKITRFIHNVRNCDAYSEEDIKICMKKLKRFHDMKLKVHHSFDIWEQIEYYERLWQGKPSLYPDYETTKENVFKMKGFIDKTKRDCCLTHIDAVCDNFLFYEKNGKQELQLTDWEYSGMQDPHVDIAMFCIYSLYDKERVDHLIDIYFEGKCSKKNRLKIYCYIAACGLLWSNWCEYKSRCGVEFGEYSLRQYRYAKEYHKYFAETAGEKYGN